MRDWKIIGFIATVVIVLSFPLYLIKSSWQSARDFEINQFHVAYTGGESCTECHKLEHDLWLESHHAKAMDTASVESVLGDFNNAEFTSQGVTSRFYMKDGKFFVYTSGPDGKMGDFQVAYTFGFTPLQQYLIPMEKGRLQCLPLTWDTEKGEWYSLVDTIYSDMEILPNDWLYWTNNGQNWNGMCADCHSTDLKKGYDVETHTFNTTWSDINVHCEACHGPGEAHLEWAKLPDIARPMDGNYGLVVQTSNIETKQYVELCARCHARRGIMSDFPGTHSDLLDYMTPQHIGEPYYHADGQILEEDYVYASFLQSRMYYNEVRCNDCHNVHSGQLVLDGNALCLQCHRKVDYDTYDHHFHKYDGEEGDPLVFADTTYYVGEGAECVSCHMPGGYYMGVDFRRDHSMRVPRPDLTMTIGTPNACNGCHKTETTQWSDDKIIEWYGKNRKPHYGTTLAAGRKHEHEALGSLIDIAGDDLYGVVIRATALSLIATYGDEKSMEALELAMFDPESIIRHAGVQHYFAFSNERYVRTFVQMLNDPVKAVRMVAAFRLSSVPIEMIDTIHVKAYHEALTEYREAQEYMGDFPSAMHNLGILSGNLGDLNNAVENYLGAIRIDDKFFPAKMNLAVLYNQQGNNREAEIVLRDITTNHPEVAESFYSLGLLLAEMQKYEEAVYFLEIAGEKIPGRGRIFYNLGLLQQYLGRTKDAEESLLRAVEIEPDNFDFLYAMADFYIKNEDLTRARIYALQILEKHPENQNGLGLMEFLNSSGR